MPQPIANFTPNLQWFGHGAGCLICGRNYSNQGAEVGIQGVDLEVAVEMEGQLGLCYECALEVGRCVGMVRQAAGDEALAAAEDLAVAAEAFAEQARADAAQARLDKDTVERLLGSVYNDGTLSDEAVLS